jgi:energy-coupling factor transporter ATP-binding protein EcfA2
LIGTNASGKSNFFDALKVLQGVGYGLTIDEVFNGKSKGPTNLVWPEIRGGSEWAVYRSNAVRPYKTKKTDNRTTFQLSSIWDSENGNISLDLIINPIKGVIAHEELGINSEFVYKTRSSSKARLIVEYNQPKTNKIGQEYNRSKIFTPNKAVLHQIPEDEKISISKLQWECIYAAISNLSDSQRLDLSPVILRAPSRQGKAQRLGEQGEDFAAVISNIIKDPLKKEALSKWLNLLTPSDIEAIKPLKTKIGDIYFGVKEGKKTVYAPSLSDGTLRFAALLTVLFQPSQPKILMIEEIENGIHPTRLKLLAELIQSRSEKSESQIFLTTHSPLLLAWLDKSLYEHVFFCYRKPDGSSGIKPLTEVPHLLKTLERFSVSELFAEGWLESAITDES